MFMAAGAADGGHAGGRARGRLSRGVGRSSRVGETQGKRRFVLTFSAQLAFPVGFFLSADLSS